MLNAEQVLAVKWALVILESIDHDCHRSAHDGCGVCDKMETLKELVHD